MTIDPATFAYLRDLVYKQSAIVLEPGKEYLIESRLGPLAKDEGFASIQSLAQQVKSGGPQGLTAKVVEAMTTNETSFFRDKHPFDLLEKEVLPDLVRKRAGTRTLRIWSAACSTGQEPYTIAMLLRERFPEIAAWNTTIVATDLAAATLERARQGRFRQLDVNRGLPVTMLIKYFTQVDGDWQIKREVKALIDFRSMNLAEPWPALGTFDVVFMRNVLIYFDVATKKTILGRVRSVLARDGYFFLGGAETTLNLDDKFQRMQVGQGVCYRVQ